LTRGFLYYILSNQLVANSVGFLRIFKQKQPAKRQRPYRTGHYWKLFDQGENKASSTVQRKWARLTRYHHM